MSKLRVGRATCCRRYGLTALGSVALVVATACLLNAAAATAGPVTAHRLSFPISVSTDHSFQQSVVGYVRRHPAARRVVIRTLEGMRTNLEAGHEVNVPDARTREDALAQIDGALAALRQSAAATVRQPAATATGQQQSTFWVSVSPDQTFQQSVVDYVQQNPASQAGVVSTLESMRTNLEAGQDVNVPDAVTSADGLDEVNGALASLATPLTGTSAPMSPAASASIDPAGFALKGSPVDELYWEMDQGTFYMKGEYCDPTGCTLTDKITAGVRTDPGAATSKFSATLSYFPNNRHYSKVHFDTWALCHYSLDQCGMDPNPQTITNKSSYTWYLSSNYRVRGAYLSHAFRLWGYFGPSGMWDYTSAKTDRALCARHDNVCKYYNYTGPDPANIAFQGTNGDLHILDASGSISDTNLGMQAGTSPSITAYPTGGWIAAIEANNGGLYTLDSNGTFSPWVGMAVGTSPSITALDTGGWVAAYQGTNGDLDILDSSGSVSDANLGMQAGTSPSIASLPDGGWIVSFQANNGGLYTLTSNWTFSAWGLSMAAGTSPSITDLSDGAWEAAYQGTNGDLYVLNSSGSVSHTNLGMQAGTSPSITSLPDEGWIAAIQANNGYLYTLNSSWVFTDQQLGMQSGTSPTITELANGGWELAFPANTGDLWTLDSSGSFTDQNIGMQASPSATGE
jgi:hypothetical protein